MIEIETYLRGLSGAAECRVNGQTYQKIERTQALALSELIAEISKNKDLHGLRWTTSLGLSGIIQPKATGKKRANISQHPNFTLEGGAVRK